MVEILVEQSFRADAAAVYACVSDHPRFIAGRGLVCRLSRDGHPLPNGLGAVREVRSGPLTLVEHITAWRPGEGYDYRIERVRFGPVPLPFVHELGEVRLWPEAGGTRVSWRSRFRVPVLGKSVETRLAAAGQRAFASLLRRAADRLGAAP
ncbi:MAG: SRPBCC family protein [Xanthomonadales bacterium]|jgi:hypothetical protein|nr:SRPBCC family protein [Xanthomonadales bacterium]